jgi:Domain of unknown function (DUF5916)/Carbohydrate family 9 binding domain-like
MAWLGFGAEAHGDLKGTPLTAHRATAAPVIDGRLDDVAWQTAPLALDTWRSYNPLYGQATPQTTEVWVAYDAQYLYLAFQCNDPEPARVRTSITRRDNIWNDDWVGFSLDALGTGQVAYHLMVNPSGVQLDMLNSSNSGEDQAPDWVWDSAGRRNEKGYAAEIRLPLETLRFKGGDRVTMGILFWRRVSRLGMSTSWPNLAPNEWVFQHHAPLVFDQLQPRPIREVIPSATYAGQQTRDVGGAWQGLDGRGDVGASGKLGLTSTITLDATVNPDFSQVESDAFQVEVNQRYPVFFSEKRPFFMEGAGLFNVAGAGNGDNNLNTAVHTRKIVDPIFGGKLTGSLGRLTFGTLVARDQAAGRDRPADDPREGHDATFVIGRAQYSLNPSNFAGLIYTDVEQASGYNRAAGADLSLNMRGGQSLSAMVLRTSTRDVVTLENSSGAAGQFNYGVSRRRFDLFGLAEHYDRDFRMDTAFYRRTGFTSGWVFGALSLYPDKKIPWLYRIVPFTFTGGGRDRIQEGDERYSVNGIRFHTTRNGFFRVDYYAAREPWQGVEYDTSRIRAFGGLQIVSWLRVFANFNVGGAIYYDDTAPFQGDSRSTSLDLTFQPNARLTEDVSIQRVDFDRRDTGADVYSLTLVNTRTTYQFSRQLYARGIVQYDSSRRRILTDLLGSYELRPGTVLFVGYGSLLERRAFDGEPSDAADGYRTTHRGLFLKASYLHRF